VSVERQRRVAREITRVASSGLDWLSFATRVGELVRQMVPFDRSCWHLVDPGTVLFTGSLNQQITCSGSWLAEHEYVIDDVNKWWFLARSGRRAGATSIATHGDPTRSARHRSHNSYGLGDELRAAFVADGIYWAAAGFLREADRPWFTEDDVGFLASLCEPIAHGFRRALIHTDPAALAPATPSTFGPGVVVYDAQGHPESISPAAEHWIAEIVEQPLPDPPAESKAVQAVAAHARMLTTDQDPLHTEARSRVRTRSGSWLLLYGTPLSGGADRRTAVIIQPATRHEVAPLVALAYGLTERERQITRLCVQGVPTKQMAKALHVSPYTIQDHLKAIFDKTGVNTRGELVGQIFLEHYIPRWEPLPGAPAGWSATADPTVS